ncbi:hypothetical protein [Pseudochrobactrum kiredjianiae]|uniref:Uncharacterized protein n=1 Tax=Pseudochrobactrum kiredjianiae TaxID=386305 RepID=A0ABW3V196_9HYPH|nr:hypothetical protein [Pseudochrobactrum kiredjianiae]MDM7852339.1 hypothetical protein [Pseudochrobactrum kiredjianiae]
MMANAKPTAQTIERVLDRCLYQVVTLAVDGSMHMDGGEVSTLSRENALELIREGNVLRVFAFNPIEGTCSDITDELEGEIEYETDQMIRDGETFIPSTYEQRAYGDSAGRRL